MTAGLIVLAGRMPARDANGRSTIGRIRVYANETTTPVSVYSSSALSTALSQPISSDSAGQFPLIWIDSANTPVTVAYEDDSGQTATYDDVTASTAAAAAMVNAYAGAVSFQFSTTTTDADPGAGKVRFDNGTIASVTNVYIDNTSLGGTSVTGWLDSFDDANVTSNRGTIAFRSLTDASVFVLLKVTGAVTDGTGYRKIPVAYLSGSLPADGTDLVMGFAAAGPSSAATVTVGTTTALATTASASVANSGTTAAAILDFGIPRGAPGGVLYTFSTTTTDSDPGAGKLRLNNATPASVTAIYIDNEDGNGNNVAGWLDSFDDSSNTIKGNVSIRQLTNGRLITFNVTGSVVDGTGYRKLTVTHTSGTVLFDNDAELSVTYDRSGDVGASGPGTGDVTGPASATNNAVALYDGPSGTLLKDSAVVIGTSANNLVQLDGSAKLPAVDGSQLTNVGNVTRAARTSNTQLVAADKGKSIEYTTGGFTQTLAACSSLGSGWFVYVVNSSTGDITFDASGSETIGGVNAATTAVLSPGQSAILITDGSNIYFAGIATGFRNMEVFTSSGTFTPKPGVSRYFIRLKGGGGGGYGASAGAAMGGSEGGEVSGFVNVTSPQTVTIGAGGSGGTASAGVPQAGTAGGSTTFGALATANGGNGGANTTAVVGGSGTFTGGLVEPGAPSALPTSGAGPGAGRGGGIPQNGGVNGGGGGGAQGNDVSAGAGGSGFCVVTW